jgi:glucuronoarabinoxylan endo-1,4-beta-xylanase
MTLLKSRWCLTMGRNAWLVLAGLVVTTCGDSGETGAPRQTGGAGGANTTGGAASPGGAATGGRTSRGGAASGGAATGGAMACGSGTSRSGDVVVELSSTQQKISGFGVSTAWASTMSEADADLLWSTTTGAGLSLHRIRIAPDGTTTETQIAKLAVARGVKVWAAPWEPVPEYRSQYGADSIGTPYYELNFAYAQAWADRLVTFVKNMESAGVPIFALSPQNEPDNTCCCHYTPAQMVSFIGSYLGPALASTGAKLIAPETMNWCGLPDYQSAILNDATASRYTPIIASHEYGCTVKAIPGIQQAGKEFWQTEIYDLGHDQEDPGMGSALRVTKRIHDDLTVANLNAWHFWWVYPCSEPSCGNGALWSVGTNTPSKRLWIMGNYSRFVRPGFYRVSTSGAMPKDVWLTAYKNPADGTVVVVAANNNNSATDLSVFISGAGPCSVTPWVTSSADSLASKSAVSVSGSRFTFSLGAQSVTTFVGAP